MAEQDTDDLWDDLPADFWDFPISIQAKGCTGNCKYQSFDGMSWVFVADECSDGGGCSCTPPATPPAGPVGPTDFPCEANCPGDPTLSCAPTLSPDTGLPPLVSNFNANVNPLSGVPPFSYSWAFADGDPLGSLSESGSVTWNNPGTHAWSVIVTDSCGNNCSGSGNVTIG